MSAAAPLRLRARGLPVVPGLGVHGGLGKQGLDRIVAREALRRGLHRVRIGGVQRGAVGRGVGRVALLQSLDQAALALARAVLQGHGPGQRGQGRRVGLGHHRHVDVRPQHEGLAPEAHRAVRVELLRRLEGTLRFGVVEAEGQTQALVEIGLRLGVARADLVCQRAEIRVQRHFAARRLHRHRLEWRGLGLGEDQGLQQRRWASDDGAAESSAAGQQRIKRFGGRAAGTDPVGDQQAGAGQDGKTCSHCKAAARRGGLRLHGASFSWLEMEPPGVGRGLLDDHEASNGGRKFLHSSRVGAMPSRHEHPPTLLRFSAVVHAAGRPIKPVVA